MMRIGIADSARMTCFITAETNIGPKLPFVIRLVLAVAILEKIVVCSIVEAYNKQIMKCYTFNL